jgi:hypothetical protein
MATLANIFNQFTGAKPVAGAVTAAETRGRSDVFRMRAAPNEDVYFFVKKIDNSRVVRQADPCARARDWRLIGGAGFAATALIAVLLPSAYGLLAGYQLTQLEQQHHRLQAERTRLELQEAKLVSTERLQRLATMQEFVDPAADKVVYLPKSDSSLALNQRR